MRRWDYMVDAVVVQRHAGRNSRVNAVEAEREWAPKNPKTGHEHAKAMIRMNVEGTVKFVKRISKQSVIFIHHLTFRPL
jgi:hypothetical protein